MEERIEIVNLGRKPRIVITGPESAGKTKLAKNLAAHYNGLHVEEFARSFIEQLGKSYVYEDVEYIARVQLQKREEIKEKTDQWIFIDTEMIITQVWFEDVFKKCPGWVENSVKVPFADLYLLCYPDLPWVEDPVRENGGERRLYLFKRYKDILELNHFLYFVVKGEGEERFHNALEGIRDKFHHNFKSNK